MKKFIPIFFVLMCTLQWMVPGKMVYDQEMVLAEGTLYKFITRPIDPADPFRGKYITLSFADDYITIDSPDEWKDVAEVYVSLYDSLGFARIGTVSANPPEEGDFVKAPVSYINSYNEPFTLHFDFTFTRFYLEESKASEAERVYWKSRMDSANVVYALVRVKNGEAALDDVMVNDRSIVDIVREINERQ